MGPRLPGSHVGPTTARDPYRGTRFGVGPHVACHQRIALTCDDAQAKITEILNFVTLSYRLFAVEENEGALFRVRRPNYLGPLGIGEHRPSDYPWHKSRLVELN